jgi:hypothetical protein
MSTVAVQSLKRIFLPVAVLLAFMIGLGLLVTKVRERAWPFTVEDALNRDLAGERSGFWDGVSWFFSTLGSTPVIIAVTAVVALVLRLTLHRWREALFLCAAVSAQAMVFFFATLAIGAGRRSLTWTSRRPRPASRRATRRRRWRCTPAWPWCCPWSPGAPG